MLQSPPLANILPFHHAAVHAAVHAAQQHHQQQQQDTSPQSSSTGSNAGDSLFGHLLATNGGSHGPHQPPGSHLPPHPHLGPAGQSPHGMPHPSHMHPGQFPPGHGPHPHFGMDHFRPRVLFRMPRVVPNQKEKFETDDLMKRHAREGEVRFTGYRDRPLHERQTKFLCGIREGHTEIAFIATGFNLMLAFDPTPGFNPANRQCDFEKEPGKVHIRSPFILNGVCVRWKGYVDLERLDGAGCLEFDEESATLEDAILKDTVEAYNRRMKEFEEHTKARSRQLAAFMGHHQAAAAAAVHAHAAAAAQAAQQAAAISSTSSPSPTTTTTSASSHGGSSVTSSVSAISANNNNTLIGQTSLFGSSHLVNSQAPILASSASNELLEVRKKQLELSSSVNRIHTMST